MNVTLHRITTQNVVECPACGGKGSLRIYAYADNGKLVTYEKACHRCHGSGYICNSEVKNGAKH